MPCRKFVVPSNGSTIQRCRASDPASAPLSSNSIAYPGRALFGSVLSVRSAFRSAVETNSPAPLTETWRCSTSPKSRISPRAAFSAAFPITLMIGDRTAISTISDGVSVQIHSDGPLVDGGPMVSPKTPPHRRRPVPIAEMGPGLRRENEKGRCDIEASKCVRALAAENGSFGDARVGRGNLGAVVEAHPRHLDVAALGEDSHARLADRDDLADFASADRAKGRGGDLARIEQVELALTCHGPGAGRRVAAADQVVHEVDMGRPVDPGLGLSDP